MEAVLDLTDQQAADASVTGAKAANLARAAAAGLPVLPGFALTTAGSAAGLDDPATLAALRTAWDGLGGAEQQLVVRSSSTLEDASESSMAGQFTSVLDVRGWDAFREAVATVLDSALRVRAPDGSSRPMAVLVQHQLDAVAGGVMFGVDPVSGDTDHIVVEEVGSRPDTLVGGTTVAAHYVLSRRGRVLQHSHDEAAPALGRSLRRRLVRLAGQAARQLGHAQDVEWAVDAQDRLWLLQSRPVTATTPQAASGRVLGPGPVAETFPDPLAPLERELFLPPLAEGITTALTVTGAAPARRIAGSPVVTAVGGWAAVDLELIGLVRGRESFWRRFAPAALVRHLGVSWRVGRTRVALPHLGMELARRVDADLAAVPALEELDDDELVDLLLDGRRELATVHAHEVLAGMLLHEDATVPTGVVALEELARARASGLDDTVVVQRHPIVLALTAPAIAAPHALPTLTAPPDDGGADGEGRGVDDLGARDALRLRTRWIQELLARTARELGRRLQASGRLADAGQVAHLTLDELSAMVDDGPAPADLADRTVAWAGPPLPDAFRLAADGRVLSVRTGDDQAQGVAAGGGRATGTACHRFPPGGADGADAHRVLVTRHLSPDLAPLLPHIDALVAETGSALSHLAILAREMDVATVVGVPDALRRFPPGTELVVDGTIGEVRPLGPAAEVEGPA